MSPPTELPRRRSWFRPQFSLGTIFWLMLVAGMGAVWWRDRTSLEQRLQKLEQMYSPSRQTLWGAADVLGAPDDPTGSAGKSWCPQRSSAVDWVEVGYDKPIATVSIDVHETYSVGCVTEVLVTDRWGQETSIWKGTDPTPAPASTGIFQVPVPASIKSVQSVKVHVDSTKRGSWACIDAVGLTTTGGKTTWATSSNSSSVYGGGSVSAASEQEAWYRFW